MSCYKPIDALYPLYPNSDGKKRLIFRETALNSRFNWNNFVFDTIYDKYPSYLKIKVPCGKCIGCRLDYSKQYALRSMDEFEYTGNMSCFVTLTFNNEHNPHTLSKVYLSQFIKRMRYYYGSGIRFMACGEYGSRHLRPHYHILFYNFRPDDLYIFKNVNGINYYRSTSFEKIYRDAYASESNGFSIFGDVTLESSAYVARYCTKKAFSNYSLPDNFEPEFLLTSRMPGLGFNYFMDNHSSILNRGYSTLINRSGKIIKFSIPRYYQNLAQKYFVKEYEEYKERCLINISDKYYNGDFGFDNARLRDLETLAKLNLDKLSRNYEIGIDLHNI